MRSLSSLIGSFGLLGLVGLAAPAFAQAAARTRHVTSMSGSPMSG